MRVDSQGATQAFVRCVRHDRCNTVVASRGSARAAIGIDHLRSQRDSSHDSPQLEFGQLRVSCTIVDDLHCTANRLANRSSRSSRLACSFRVRSRTELDSYEDQRRRAIGEVIRAGLATHRDICHYSR